MNISFIHGWDINKNKHYCTIRKVTMKDTVIYNPSMFEFDICKKEIVKKGVYECKPIGGNNRSKINSKKNFHVIKQLMNEIDVLYVVGKHEKEHPNNIRLIWMLEEAEKQNVKILKIEE